LRRNPVASHELREFVEDDASGQWALPEEPQERTDQHQSDRDPPDALKPPRTTLVLKVLIDVEISATQF